MKCIASTTPGTGLAQLRVLRPMPVMAMILAAAAAVLSIITLSSYGT